MSEIVPNDKISQLPERYQLRARQIAERVSEIDTLVRPCDPRAIRDAVIRLRSQFRPQPNTETVDMLADFKLACVDLPEWALSEATNDFLGGKVDNHTGQFMPTSAEFAIRVRSIIRPFLSERHALRSEASKLIERARDERRRHIVEMERQDPAVRKRVAEMIHRVTNGSDGAAPVMKHVGLSAERQAAIDALKIKRVFTSKLAETRLGRSSTGTSS